MNREPHREPDREPSKKSCFLKIGGGRLGPVGPRKILGIGPKMLKKIVFPQWNLRDKTRSNPVEPLLNSAFQC